MVGCGRSVSAVVLFVGASLLAIRRRDLCSGEDRIASKLAPTEGCPARLRTLGISRRAFRRSELARDQAPGPALVKRQNLDRQQAGSYRNRRVGCRRQPQAVALFVGASLLAIGGPTRHRSHSRTRIASKLAPTGAVGVGSPMDLYGRRYGLANVPLRSKVPFSTKRCVPNMPPASFPRNT